MARSTLDNMAFHSDPLVREIYSQIDDRPEDEIGASVHTIWFGTAEEWDREGQQGWVDPTRSLQEPTANEHLTREQAADATILADQIADWANYGVAYDDFGHPPWEPPWEPTGNPQSTRKNNPGTESAGSLAGRLKF